MRRSQKERILDFLKQNKTITSLECVYKLNIVDLQHSIMVLRREGYLITDKWEQSENARYKRYTLEGMYE
jgi:hypothetical protein